MQLCKYAIYNRYLKFKENKQGYNNQHIEKLQHVYFPQKQFQKEKSYESVYCSHNSCFPLPVDGANLQM